MTKIQIAAQSFLAAGIAVWISIVKWTLEKSGSAPPIVAMRRFGSG